MVPVHTAPFEKYCSSQVSRLSVILAAHVFLTSSIPFFLTSLFLFCFKFIYLFLAALGLR